MKAIPGARVSSPFVADRAGEGVDDETKVGELWPKLLLLEWMEKLLMWLLLLLSSRTAFDDMIITGALVASVVIDAAISWVCPTICTAWRIAATSQNVSIHSHLP